LYQSSGIRVDFELLYSPCFIFIVEDKHRYFASRNGTLHPGNEIFRQSDQGRNLRGYGDVTPPPPKKNKKTNHLDWQGESSGFAGQSKILNDRM
jgi:hypothetical protein